MLADDSNFRGMAMELSAAPAAAMLTLPPEAFQSAWCAGDAADSPAPLWACHAQTSPADPLRTHAQLCGASILGMSVWQRSVRSP